MAEIVGGAATSHVPAIGVAIDRDRRNEPYWAPYFDKLVPIRKYAAELAPDVCFLIYNDHANAFALDVIPTFAIGLSEEFLPADEGFGRRNVPRPAIERAAGPGAPC